MAADLELGTLATLLLILPALAGGVLLRNVLGIEANGLVRSLIWAMMLSWLVPACALFGLRTPRRTWRAQLAS